MRFLNDKNIIAAISEKKDGSCRVGVSGAKNRKTFLEGAGIAEELAAIPLIIHGNKVAIAKNPGTFPGTDGLATNIPGVYLTVTVADCLPVFLYEPREKIIGLLHAGWRGLQGGIIQSGVKAMLDLGGNAEDIIALIGPGIGPCHFEVQGDLLREFRDYPEASSVRDGRHFLDLKTIALKMLVGGGLKPENATDSGICTACSPDFFSFRRDKPAELQTMVAVFGMRS